MTKMLMCFGKRLLDPLYGWNFLVTHVIFVWHQFYLDAVDAGGQNIKSHLFQGITIAFIFSSSSHLISSSFWEESIGFPRPCSVARAQLLPTVTALQFGAVQCTTGAVQCWKKCAVLEKCAVLAWEGQSSVTSLGAGADRSPQTLHHDHHDQADDDDHHSQLKITNIFRSLWESHQFHI